MNISHDHKVIWWTKPEMGEKLIADNLAPLNFSITYNAGNISPLTKKKISYIQKFPDEYKDYSLIVSTRNPYFQIINHYLKISETNWTLKTSSFEEYIENLNRWVSEIFSVDKQILLTTDSLLQNVFPYNFTEKKPDFIIKYEKIQENLTELLFLMNMDYKHNDNLIKNNQKFEIGTLTFENARKIYKTHKEMFDLFDYDPFSFSSHDFSLKEKVDFIHN